LSAATCGLQESATPGEFSSPWLDEFEKLVQVFDCYKAGSADNAERQSAGANQFFDCEWICPEIGRSDGRTETTRAQ